MPETIRLLNPDELTLLNALYRQSKFCDGIQINFLCAKLGLPHQEAECIAMDLNAIGLLEYRKYGVLRLTEIGKEYLQYNAKPAKLDTGDKNEKGDYYSGLLQRDTLLPADL